MSDYWFVFQNDRLLLRKTTVSPSLITDTETTILKQHYVRHHKLGQIEQQAIYCSELNIEFDVPNEFELVPFRKALELLGMEWYTTAVKAYSIIKWDKNHQYCGYCGTPTMHKLSNSFERECPACHLLFYPRISPSIIVLIQKNNEVLMARSPHFQPGIYALIAGFVEPGESLEDAVHREVKEEVGISITNLRYFGSQAWPFPDSLMIGFNADYLAGEITPNPNEIEAAGWYRYDNLPGRPSFKLSISSLMLDAYIDNQTGKSS